MSKKDPNYAAKLEKEIEKKYGKEAIENPKAGWDDNKEKEFLSDSKALYQKELQNRAKEEKTEINGILVSKRLINTKKADRSCPVCKKYSFNSSDDVYMSKFDCCFDCYILYVEDREERWLSGWRPEEEIK